MDIERLIVPPPLMPNPDLTFVRETRGSWEASVTAYATANEHFIMRPSDTIHHLFSACLLRCPMPVVTGVRVPNVVSSQIATAKMKSGSMRSELIRSDPS